MNKEAVESDVGPGSYNVSVDSKKNRKLLKLGGQQTFFSSSERFRHSTPSVPGPGQYNQNFGLSNKIKNKV